MADKIKLDLSYRETASIARALATAQKDPKAASLHKNLVNRLWKQPVNPTFLRQVSLPPAAANFDSIQQQLLAQIVHGISVLTGVPEPQIKLASKLASLGLTDLKLDQLRVFINKFIKQQRGRTFIAPSDLDTLTTVQDLFNLAISLIP